jgi:hypothetical protein
LQEITADAAAKGVGKPVAVQFNPSTLKLRLANEVEGGNSRGRQARQYVGKSSTELSLELVFDTSDEGDDDHPRPVREKTAIVEKYVLPRKEGKEAPPKLRFQWGNLVVDGVVDSVDIEFDHFASDGTALRATVALTLKEQDSKYQFLQSGPGAKKEPGTKTPLDAASAGSNAGPPARVAPALGGETPADFAARMGLDPSAWRGLQVDLSAGLALEAGVEVGFSLDLGVGVGLGVHAGVESGAGATMGASLGLEGGPGSDLALAAAGGFSAASATARAAHAQSAATASKGAFSTQATRAAGDALSVKPAASAPPSSSAMDRPDPRSLTFGFGVPLRPWVTGAASDRSDLILGGARVQVRALGGDPPFRGDPTTPPWVALPRSDPGRARADGVQATRRPRSCGCQGPCGHHR